VIDLDCAGCQQPLDAEQGYGAVGGLHGYLCPPCYHMVTRKQGRMCNTCIRRANARWGAKTTYVLNNHRQRHSKVVDECVDAGVQPFVDAFNLHVTPTWVSCEGQPRPTAWKPGAPWIYAPYLGVSERMGGDPNAAVEWAAINHDRYQITEVSQHWDPGHTVAIRFRELPTWID
jgi:hypothetical protein